MTSLRVIVLAAGRGRRMRPAAIDTPKCLLRAGGETLLGRMLRQLAEYPDVDEVVLVAGHSADRLAAAARAATVPVRVVFNDEFARDDNLRSAIRGLEAVDRSRPTMLMASDLWLDDGAVHAIVETTRADASAVFTCGAFDPGTVGCAVHHDARGRVDEIRVDVAWEPGLASHRRALGAAVVSSRDAETFLGLAAEGASRGDARYEEIWARNLGRIETRGVDLHQHRTASIDTGEQHADLCETIRRWRGRGADVRLVPLEWLRPVEHARPERVAALGSRVDAEAIWHQALVVDRRFFLVLDGTHRLEVARQRGFRQVPVVMVDYEAVPAWSLLPGVSVSREQILARALSGDPFPAGSIKHQLPPLDLSCRYVLARLAA